MWLIREQLQASLGAYGNYYETGKWQRKLIQTRRISVAVGVCCWMICAELCTDIRYQPAKHVGVPRFAFASEPQCGCVSAGLYPLIAARSVGHFCTPPASLFTISPSLDFPHPRRRRRRRCCCLFSFRHGYFTRHHALVRAAAASSSNTTCSRSEVGSRRRRRRRRLRRPSSRTRACSCCFLQQHDMFAQ